MRSRRLWPHLRLHAVLLLFLLLVFASRSYGNAEGFLDLSQVLQQASLVNSEDYPDADDVMIDDHIVVRYEEDGRSISWDDTVLKVLSEKGKKDKRILSRYFTESYSRVHYSLVQVIRPDGQVLNVDLAAQSQIMVDPSQMRSNIYDPNSKILQVTLPELEVGDLIRYVVCTEIIKPRVPNTFSDYEVLEYTSPILNYVYEVHAPKNLPLRSIAVKDEVKDSLTFTQREEADRLIYRWQARKVPRMFPEADMPPLHTVVQRLLVSTVAQWEDISRWYWQVSEPHYAHSEAMQEKVQELCAGLADRDDKIRAIFRFVSQEIRYMGITVETEAPGYEPHDVQLTFDKRHGVCRDKAALLVVMLRLAGFEAFPVLIHNGPLKDPEVPQPFFNHAITAVLNDDGSYQLMDATDENTMELFPAYLCRKSYLVARPDGDTLRSSPISPASENMMVIETRASIDGQGKLLGNSIFRFDGINDNAYRGALARRSPEQRRQFFEGVVKRVAPGARLTRFELSPADMMDTSEALALSLGFAAEDVMIANDSCAMLELPRFSHSVGMVNFILGQTGLEQRRFPFVTEIACGVKEQVILDLDPAWGEAEALPDYPQVDSDTLTWQRQLSWQNHRLSLDSEFSIKTVEFSPEQYLDLKNKLKLFEINARKMALFNRLATSPGESAAAPDQEALILSQEDIYQLHSGSEWQHVQRVRKQVSSYKGKKEHAELKLHYNPVWEELTLNYARVINGENCTEISAEEINVMDAAWVGSAPRYPAGKTLVASLPGVEVGSIIEYEVSRRRRDAPFFAINHSFQGFDPCQEARLSIDTPVGMPMTLAYFPRGYAFRGDGGDSASPAVSSSQEIKDGRELRSWILRDIPALRRETQLPPRASFTPTLCASTGSWAYHSQQLSVALRSHCTLGPRGEALLANVSQLDPCEQLRAVRDYIARNIRQSGPNFTDLPMSCLSDAEQTLHEGYGHNADRAIATAALLKRLGFAPEFILSASNASPPAISRHHVTFPHVYAFPQILLRVTHQGETIWLNDSDEYAELGSCAVEGATAITLQGQAFTVSVPPIYQNRSENNIHLSIHEDGSATMTQLSIYYGNEHAAQKRFYAELTPEKRRRHYQELLVGASQSAVAASDLITDFASYPGQRLFTARIADYATLQDSFLYLRLPVSLGGILRQYTDRREHPILWQDYRGLNLSVAVSFPPSFSTLQLSPQDHAWRFPGSKGSLKLSSERLADNQFRFHVRGELPAALIPPGDYPELLNMNRLLNHPAARTLLMKRQ
jgi:transglutaminase-like putative cysteine protease